MKYMTSLAGMAAVLVLVGAGCAPAEEPQVKNADTPEQTDTSGTVTVPEIGMDAQEETPAASDLTVTAEATGGNKVSVAWTVPAEMAADKDITAYRILVGKTENPTWDNKYFWFERGSVYRDKVLEGLRLGEQHIRVCAVKANECVAFSNNVMVDVK